MKNVTELENIAGIKTDKKLGLESIIESADNLVNAKAPKDSD